jgi:G3E family GTPase
MKLEKFVANWPSSIIRAKGIIWFADNNDEGFIFEQAGKQIVASYAGDWLAVAPKRHIKKVMASDPEVVKNWDEKLGDRMVKIVFIGRDMDKSKTIAALDECTVEPKLK